MGKRNFFSTGHWAQLSFFLTKGTSGPPFKYTYLSYVLCETGCMDPNLLLKAKVVSGDS